MTDFQLSILIGTSIYILVMIFIGFWAGRLIKTPADYIIAGRKLSFPLSLGTIFATWFGAETVLGSSSTANQEGILGVIADPYGAGLCLIISGLFLVPAFYKFNITTNIDYFEKKYNKHVGFIMTLIYLPPYIGWIGAQMLAFGTIFSHFTAIPIKVAILLSAAIVIIYTYAGGMLADAITDFVQMFFILVGIIFLFIYILINHQQEIATVSKEMYSFFPKSKNIYDWLNYIEAWMIVGLGSLGGQDLVARILAAKNAKIARRSSILAGLLYWVLGSLPVLLGIWAAKILPESTDNSVLVALAMKYLPYPLLIIFLGALLSAIMSTVDTALLAPASLIGENVFPYFNKNASDKQKLIWCRISVVVLGLLSLIIALRFESIYELCLESWTFLLTSFTAPLLFSLFWKKTTSYGVVVGALGGVLGWAIFNFFIPNISAPLGGFLISCLFVLVISLLTKEKTHIVPEIN
ncbi:MAG: sodium:solute symporter family protein [Spirochaetes bacterium]|nr:sodium:solute symporter family protein [Spirochaetota bacterium]